MMSKYCPECRGRDNVHEKTCTIARAQAYEASRRAADNVNHPQHYTAHPSGVECIEVVEHMGFNLGCAVKYIWRADLKGAAIEDLEKAAWYVQREIALRRRKADLTPPQR